MVGGLPPLFDLPQGYSGIGCRLPQHLFEGLGPHKVRTAAGGEIAAPRQQLHGLQVDLLITPERCFRRLPALRKGRRIQDDVVEGVLSRGDPLRPLAVCKRSQKIEHVRLQHSLSVLQTVQSDVFAALLAGVPGDVHGDDLFRARRRTVHAEGAGVGEAVQHRLPFRQFRRCLPVVFLVQEEPGLLAVDKVHVVKQSVLGDGHVAVPRIAVGAALSCLHPFFRPDRSLVALVDAAHLHPVVRQHLPQQAVQQLFAEFDAERQHLRHQHVLEAVHRKPGEAVRLAEDEPAAAEVRLAHHCAAVGDGVLDAAPPEGFLEAVVGVAGDEPHTDLGVVVDEPGAHPAVLFRADIHDIAVLIGLRRSLRLFPVYPGMAGPQRAGRFFVADNSRILSHG